MITSTVYFESTYGKKVELTITQDKHGDYSCKWARINGNYYKVRTAARENILIEYASEFVDLDEHFAEERYSRSHQIDY